MCDNCREKKMYALRKLLSILSLSLLLSNVCTRTPPASCYLMAVWELITLSLAERRDSTTQHANR